MAFGLRVFAEGTASGLPILGTERGEEFMHIQPGVALVLGNRAPESPGTLYIANKQVVWLSDVDVAKGFSVDFLSILLHAVSRDPEIETGTNAEDLDDLSSISEMRLVPSDPDQLDNLFDIFCECAELNPEPVEARDDSKWPVPEIRDNPIGYSNGNHDLAKSMLQLQINDLRFEDAEEM